MVPRFTQMDGIVAFHTWQCLDGVIGSTDLNNVKWRSLRGPPYPDNLIHYSNRVWVWGSGLWVYLGGVKVGKETVPFYRSDIGPNVFFSYHVGFSSLWGVQNRACVESCVHGCLWSKCSSAFTRLQHREHVLESYWGLFTFIIIKMFPWHDVCSYHTWCIAYRYIPLLH